MGLSGGKGRGLLGRFDPNGLVAAQALLDGDYGGAAQIFAQQRRERADRANAEREAERRYHVAQALTGLGFSKAQLAAMHPEDADRLLAGQFIRQLQPGPGQGASRAAPLPGPPEPEEIVVSGSRADVPPPDGYRPWRFGGFTPFGWGGFPGVPR